MNGGRLRDPFAYRIATMVLPDSTVSTSAVAWDLGEVTCTLNEAHAAADALPETHQKRKPIRSTSTRGEL